MSLIDKEDLIAEYDRVHQGPPGGARKLMEKAETVEAIPVDWIKEYIDTAEEMEGFAAKFVVASITGMLNAWKKEQKEK